MNVVAKRLGSMVRVIVIAAMILLVANSRAWAAEPCGLPDNWRNLPLQDFMKAAEQSYVQGKLDAASYVEQSIVREHAKQFFLPIDLTNTQLDYRTIDNLHFLVNRVLETGVNTRVRSQLLARQDDWAGKPYSEIKGKFQLMERLGLPRSACVAEARRWVQAGGTLDQVDAADRTKEAVRQIFATDAQAIEGSFAVHWEGLANPPETGNYTFSISPININSKDPRSPVKFTMQVKVEGKQVLSATPENWVSQSAPVELPAGGPVLVQVDLSADVHEIPPLALHAQLYWQGPGTVKQIIPTARLTQPGTTDKGFHATYTWVDKNSQPQTLSRTDRTIDFAWTNTVLYLGTDTSVPDQASDAVWQEVSTEEYLNWLETSGTEVKWHPYFREIRGAPASLTSDRRQAFLGKLLAHPAVLGVLAPKDAVNLYQGFRYGTDDKALEAFGKWAAGKADLESNVSTETEFELETRDSFRRMAVYVTQELPTEVARLQSDYLELPDGRCCLPVAYTLAYSYLGKGQLDQWISLLDARLADNNVTGDKRINWLLARAHAEEIRHAPADPYTTPNSRPLDGRGYIVEGLLTAESAAAKARASRELAVRLASTQQFTAARDELQQTANSLPEADRASLTALQQSIDALEAAQVQAQADHATAAKNAYLNTLKQRRDKAAAAGDTEAANRYESLIQAASQ